MTASSMSAPSLIEAAGRSYFPIAFVARFPYAMMVVGVLTLVVSGRSSLGLGGLTSAMVGLGTAVCAPLIGAAADRFGQRRVVLVAGIVSSMALLLITWVVYSPLPDGVVLLSALLIGATTPQIPPMSRSRLVGIISRRYPAAQHNRVTGRTMAYESAADEMTFVVGPVIVGALAATMDAAAPVIGAALLTLVFVTAFALHRSAGAAGADAARSVQPAPVRELMRAPLLVVVIGVLGIGLFFGSVLTSLTSFMGDAGHPESAGLVYGMLGVGSAVLALSTALFPARFSLRARWLSFAVVMVLGSTALPFVTSVPMMLVVLLVLGVGLGPTLVTLFSFVARRSPRGRSATAMTLASTGVVVGQSGAAAIIGQVGERFGTQAATLGAVAASLLIAVMALANWSFASEESETSA